MQIWQNLEPHLKALRKPQQMKDYRDSRAEQGLVIAVKCFSECSCCLGSWTLSHLYFQNADHLMCGCKEFTFYFRVLAVVFMELGKQKKRQGF